MTNSQTHGAAHRITITAVTFALLTMSIYSGWEVVKGIVTYRALTSAIAEGARFAAARGAGVTVGEIARAIQDAGEGLEADRMDITLTSQGHSYDCGALAKCVQDPTRWPPSEGELPDPAVTVRAVYSFRADLATILRDPESVTVHYRAEATAF